MADDQSDVWTFRFLTDGMPQRPATLPEGGLLVIRWGTLCTAAIRTPDGYYEGRIRHSGLFVGPDTRNAELGWWSQGVYLPAVVMTPGIRWPEDDGATL
jgi:hypothetical protein